jgi:diguanylate cyclase (GGDEF)-like protein
MHPALTDRSAPAVHVRSRSGRVWIAAAILLMLGGIIISVGAARSVARTNARVSMKSFEQSSADVASTLQLAIQHQSDLTLDTAGFVLSRPDASQSEFVHWITSAHAFARYPELEGIGVVRIVPAAKLAAYALSVKADPAGPLGPDGTLSVTPSGSRPFYCLTSQALSRTVAVQTPAGTDVCDGAAGTALLAARDSGQGEYAPFAAGNQTWLGIETPTYVDGRTPTTVSARRREFVGWVGILANPTLLMDRALQAHHGLSVSLHYVPDANGYAGAGSVAFAAGHAPAGATSSSISLHNGWTVTTHGTVAADSVFADRDAWLLLLACIGFSLLLGVLMIVLSTGRERARRLVAQRTEQLWHQALHDALTGLPNRALVLDRIETNLALNRRHGWTGAVLYIDLDDFKNVNDTLGHQAGDQLLVAVAVRLASTLRATDTIGRMGGDEFVVLVDGAGCELDPKTVADRLLEATSRPFVIEAAATPLTVTLSIGIAMGNRPTAGDLLRDADLALYEAKAMGKGRYHVFDPTVQTAIGRRNDLEFDLRSALTGDQYRLVYQPIYDIDDLTIVGVEALLRWERPHHGHCSPDEFIPLLEQTGQMPAVGRWVLNQACEQMATWHSRGDHLNLSVNISGRQLDDNSIVGDIRDALATSGLDPSSLTLEITETALMRDAEATVRRLKAIKELGVSLAIDDFGTGYSSLAYLRQFPVDCLKIDRMFTNAATGSAQSETLLRNLAQLGADLGLTTVAEGVETADELDLLRRAGVDLAQGFLMSRPLDPSALDSALLAPTRAGGQLTGRAPAAPQ